MRCSEVYEALDGLSQGTESRYRHIPDLLHLGLLKTVPRIQDSPDELENLKRKLYDIKEKIRSLRSGGIDADGGTKIKDLQTQEIELRQQILDIVQNMRPADVVRTSRGDVTRVSTICFKPNGVLLSPDDQTLYLADSRGQCIYKYDVAGPGKLADETRWIDNLGANPDGMTLDEHDNLYICLGRAGLKVYSPNARPIGVVEVPYASNTCFGGRDFTMLFITSADKFLGIRTKVVGIKPPCLLNA